MPLRWRGIFYPLAQNILRHSVQQWRRYKHPCGRLSLVTGHPVASSEVGSCVCRSLFLLARIFYDIGYFVYARLVIPFSVYLSPCGVLCGLVGIIPDDQRGVLSMR